MKIMPDMKPILFNTDMVRALLDNRKTVTRRVIKNTPKRDDLKPYKTMESYGLIASNSRVSHFEPPYRPNEIIYVREAFAKPYGGEYRYRADYNNHDIIPADRGDVSFSANLIKWRPSIHMPREAARIFLRVTNVRVERLQDITEEQARAEGVEPLMMTADVDKPDCEKRWQEMLPALSMFPEIWNSTIKPTDLILYGWDANPYVFVISFERISKDEAMQ